MALFVDVVSITVKAGDGGDGCVAFHREKYVQAGGPDGGDGGRGGDVKFMATERMHTLMDFRFTRRYFADNGANGTANCRTGKSGSNIVIQVPVGTIVKEKDTDRVLLDMNEPNVEKMLMRGGNGGFGNQHFATPTRQAPQFAKPGETKKSIDLTLELKSIADVGLVGFPNVGKSTILSVVTAARPKIANYHFTTLQPNLGIVKQGDTSFVLADIPGLVEGASEGIGLGYDFLRHIERTRVLIHVLDISGSEGRDPIEDYYAIMKEVEAYGDLKSRPMLIAANKTDLPGAEENLERLKKEIPDVRIFPISAATHKGFDPLMFAAAEMVDALPIPEPFYEEDIDLVGKDEGYEIEHVEGAFVLSGGSMDRLIRSVNFGNADSLNYFHRTLRKWGIIDQLRQAGAKEGDAVIIGDMEFDFVD